MNPTASTTSAAAAPSVDLELRVTTHQDRDGTALEYVLHSPNGVAPYHQHRIGGGLLREPERFQAHLFAQLEKLSRGLDADGTRLLDTEIEGELAALGRELYKQLFPSALRRAYLEIRDTVKTVLVTSDEPWIPWELVRPFEDRDDDFLGVRFKLTRWLPGAMPPPGLIRVSRLACVTAGNADSQALPEAEVERQLVASLAAEGSGLVDDSPEEATFEAVVSLLERGELDLLHFVGHGDYEAEGPNESKIVLADRPLRVHHLSGLPCAGIRNRRPLVFLNACRVARQGWALTGLGGWAERWVRECGCGAFVGPQWAVRDGLARRFAEILYQELGLGATFGEAVRTARREIQAEFPGDPGRLAFSVYAHPTGRLALGTAEPPPRLWLSIPRTSVPPEIRGRILNYGRFIAEKTTGFVGRQWLFDAIDRFVRKHPRGYFLINGDPGIGKSAVAAQLVERRGYPHHFNIRREGISRPEHFLANICAQLVAAHELPYTFLPPEATRDGNFLKELLEHISERLSPQKDKVILVVDALDETDDTGQPEGANPLPLPLILPPGVYVIITSRRGTPFGVECEYDEIEIIQDDKGNIADVQLFVESHLERPGIRAYRADQGLDAETFVAEMVDKSQGNFMYLRYVLPEIERGVYKDRAFTALPKGLDNYYEDHWTRMRSRDESAWFDLQIPVLVALTVIKEPVSLDLMTDFSGVKDRRRIRDVLVRWDPFLYTAEVVDDETGERQKRYRLYHESFHDFIAAKDEVAEERVDLKAAHGKIADVLWTDLYGEE